MRDSNPRLPRCKRGTLAAELIARDAECNAGTAFAQSAGGKRSSASRVCYRHRRRHPCVNIRFESSGKIHHGVIDGDRFARRIDGPLLGRHRVTEERLPVDRLLAPIVPTDILCIGLNYREHAAEGKFDLPAQPMLFIKSGNTPQRPRGTDPAAEDQPRDRLRRRTRGRHRPGCEGCFPRRSPRLRVRVHDRQRRDRPRLAARQGPRRRTVRARQELRRLLPARAGDRHAGRSRRPEHPVDSHDSQRHRHAGRHYRRHDLRRPHADRVAE